MFGFRTSSRARQPSAFVCRHAVAGLPAVSSAQSAPSGPFLEQNGQVVMEAEYRHGIVARGGTAWTPQTNPSGFVGSAMQALPNTGGQVNSNYTTTAAEMQFQVEFDGPGTYHVWLRGYAATSDDNAAHVGVEWAGGDDRRPADAADVRGVDMVQEHDGRAGGDGVDSERRHAHDQRVDTRGRAVHRSAAADDQRELDADG